MLQDLIGLGVFLVLFFGLRHLFNRLGVPT